MQYELYSKNEEDIFCYHITTNDIKTILFYIFNDDDKSNYIIIDNYDVKPINYRLLGFKQKPTEEEHRKMIFECKQVKYIDFYFEQGMAKEKISQLSIKSAKQETDFYFMRLNQINEEY